MVSLKNDQEMVRASNLEFIYFGISESKDLFCVTKIQFLFSGSNFANMFMIDCFCLKLYEVFFLFCFGVFFALKQVYT